MASSNFLSSSSVHSALLREGSKQLTHLHHPTATIICMYIRDQNWHSHVYHTHTSILKEYLSLHCTCVRPGTHLDTFFHCFGPKRVTATLKRLSSSRVHFPDLTLVGWRVFSHLHCYHKIFREVSKLFDQNNSIKYSMHDYLPPPPTPQQFRIHIPKVSAKTMNLVVWPRSTKLKQKNQPYKLKA